MKKVILTFVTILMVAGLLHGKGYAYTTISASDAYEIFTTNEELVVVDVRETWEYCSLQGHIPCAINYIWDRNSLAFSTEEYENLPTDAPILLVCASGNRSRQAAIFLENHGYETVYSLGGGMYDWPYDTATCDDIEDCDSTYPVYFPHIASGNGWETEISVINTSQDTPVSGIFKTYNADGELLDNTHTLELPAAGRLELVVGEFFSNPTQIRYIILETANQTTYGYLKFYNYPELSYRASIPAITNINQNNISVSHIAIKDGWWTGLALVNTTDEDREIMFTFNNDENKALILPAKTHEAINLTYFLEGLSTNNIKSAIISNAEGIIGLEIFGNNMQLGGISLNDSTSTTLYYPHIASDNEWWTGIAAFNPGSVAGEIIIKPFTADGTRLSPVEPATSIEIAAESNFVKLFSQLQLPADTDWLIMEATVPINGFELFGTYDGRQLAGYSSIDIDGLSGIFPKNSDNGWTGLAIANTSADNCTLTLTAYDNNGQQLASSQVELSGFEKTEGFTEDFFSEDIDTATYIAYSATVPVVVFQLNSNDSMLDALPGRQ